MTNLRKGSRGFTLVELMVVVAILSVLMSVVFPAVTGTKSVSTEGQVATDAKSTQTAVDNFNNKSVKTGKFPEQDLGTKYAYSGTGTIKLPVVSTTQAVAVFKNKSGGSATVDATTHSEIKFSAGTDIWQADGTVNAVTFVPDFLLREPSSTILQNDEGAETSVANTKLYEFLWLLKKNEVGKDAESRTVELYRLTAYDSTTKVPTYTQLY